MTRLKTCPWKTTAIISDNIRAIHNKPANTTRKRMENHPPVVSLADQTIMNHDNDDQSRNKEDHGAPLVVNRVTTSVVPPPVVVMRCSDNEPHAHEAYNDSEIHDDVHNTTSTNGAVELLVNGGDTLFPQQPSTALHHSSPAEPVALRFSMREQDAELLESMHEDGTTGHTPLVTSSKTPQAVQPEMFSLDERNSFRYESPPRTEDSFTMETTTKNIPSSFLQEPKPPSSPTISIELPTSMSLTGRSLSGEVTLRNPWSVATEAVASTASQEIRIHEVARFAEAVGDTSILLCDIIDDDDDDDESENDDGETVIHHRLLDPLLPAASTQTDTMMGICTPDIVQRGVVRGNYATLHRKALLEVSDKYHRYGKNLRVYYKHWESMGCPTNQFFDWLDSKGTAAGHPLPELASCPRSKLDCDTVLYITNPDVTEQYRVDVTTDKSKRACLLDTRGNPVVTGPDGWIFVLRDQVLYAAPKITSVVDCSTQRFHHSSFFGGKAVAAAGILITNSSGILEYLYPHSGHYRPTAAHLQRVLFFLYETAGVDLSSGLAVDAQQILHVARDPDAPKRAQLHMVSAMDVALFLAHKARSIPSFGRLHGIARAPSVTTVREALAVIDDGGYWQQQQQQWR